MKRYFVMSDSHGAKGMLLLATDRIKDGEYNEIIHLGDGGDDVDWLEEKLGRRLIAVSGNCDFFTGLAKEIVLREENVKLMLCHGHIHGVKLGLDRLSYHAEEQGCAAAFYGHTHEAFAGQVGGVLLMNPGSLLSGCYGEVEFEGDRIRPRLLRI